MSNEDFDFAEPPINFNARRAQVLAATSVEDNPDDAARALQLARSSGANPGMVYENRENFEQQYRTKLSGEIIKGNSFIQDYVNDHPLSAKVSNDDYGQLDAASKAIQKVRGGRPSASDLFAGAMFGRDEDTGSSVLGAFLKGFKETSDLESLPAESEKLSFLLAQQPFFANHFIRAATVSGTTAFAGAMKTATGIIGGTAAGIGEAYKQFGASEADQGKLIRDLIVWAQVGMSGQGGLHAPLHPALEAPFKKAADLAKVLEPYVKDGVEPPVGLHPLIDEAKKEQAKIDADNLGEALKESVKSATRERDPDMFAGFAEKHVGNSQIGISADAVRRLYGDKIPEDGDGKLGFVPNLMDQLARAEVTGGDIQVAIKDYLARIEPEVHKELEDHIRARPEGMTVEEGKEPPKYEDEPSISLQRTSKPEEWLHKFNIVDKEGNVKADLEIHEEDNGKALFVRDIQSETGPGALGPKAVRDVFEQLKTEFPNAETIRGYRGTGARRLADATGKAEASMQSIRQSAALEGPSERAVVEAPKKPTGTVRFYHGGRDAATGGARWVTPDEHYARRFNVVGSDPDNVVHYVDISEEQMKSNPALAGGFDEINNYYQNFEAPEEYAKQLKPLGEAPTELEGEAKAAFEKASAIGMTSVQYKRYQRLIEKRAVEDREAATARVMSEQRKRQTEEWKANRAEIRKDVAGEFAKKPEHIADEMLRSQGTKLDAAKLTPEQRAALPEKYIATMRRPGRTDPDRLAETLGVNSGDELVARLIALNKDRADMKPGEFLKKSVDAETDRRMESQYGSLDKSILEEAKDQVLSETQEEMLHEETLARAAEAGLEFSITKEGLKAAVKDFFDRGLMREMNSDENLAAAGRAGRATEDALLKGDFAEAFRQKQRQYLAFTMGRLAKKLEKERKGFEKTADRYLSREVSGQSPEYTNAVHDILQKLGYPIERSPEDLARETQALGYTGLADFIAKKEEEHRTEGLEFDVPDFLLQDGFKKSPDELTVGEFQAMKAGVDNLIHVGRAEQKVTVGGAKLDRRQLIQDMHEQLKAKWPAVTVSARREKEAKKLLNSAIAASTNLETLFQRFDGRDPSGIFTKTFVYPGAEAANYKARLEREFGAEYKALGKIKDSKKKLDGVPLLDPETGEPIRDFTRENLHTVISNMGNDYNFKVFAKGWGVESQTLWDWVMKNSAREDFDRAHELSKIFDKGKRMADVVYRNIKGVAPEDIPVRPFEAHGKQYPGWYHPIIRDDFLSDVVLDKDPLEKPTNFWPSPANGYIKKRKGTDDVLSINNDMVPAKLNQILHDVAFRDFIVNSAKITRDKEFRSAVARHYGKEYVEEINKWIERVAGNASYNSEGLSRAVKASNFLRQNVITTHIAFNLTTIEKHAATAAMMSARELGPNTLVGALKLGKLTAEVGLDSLYHATMDLFGKSSTLGDSLSKFINDTSEEIQRRERHYQDTVTDVHDALSDKSSVRQMVAYWGAKGVAFSDKLSAKPLWLGKYREVMEETGDHGQAVAQANFSVRRAHGSTAITSLPRIAAGGGVLEPWMTSLYGFMGANMQRRIEIAHDISDTYKLAKGGELGSALRKVPGIIDSTFANVLWVGAIEEIVSGQFTDDRRGFGQKALGFAFQTLAQSIIGVRDLAYGLTHGRAPQVGLLSSTEEETTALIRDLKKPHPLSKLSAGKFVQDTLTAVGDLVGVAPKPIARAIRFGMDVNNNVQRPKTLGDWYRGIVSGQAKQHVER